MSEGDAGVYACPRCDDELTLTEVVDHIERHAAHLGEVTR